MNRATQALLSAVLLAAFAWAQDTPTPPEPPQTPATPQTPTTSETPQTPETPATPRTPRAPRAPRPPKPPKPPHVDRGSYLGIDSRDVTPERASALKLPKASGVEVVMVDQDAPAGKAGMKEHDVIVGFNGKPVTDPFELRKLIRDTNPGDIATVGIVRDGKSLDLKVKLAGRPEWGNFVIPVPKFNFHPMPDIDVPAIVVASRRNGITVEPITRQLADAFGVKDGHGVMVRSVEKNSGAEAAGFRAGDIIVRVGSEVIDSVNDWNQVTRQNAGGKVAVTVVREKREQNLTLALPEKRNEGSAVYFPGPDVNVDVDLSQLQSELAKIGPEVEKSITEAQKEWAKTWNSEEFQKQMQDAQRAARDAMRLNRAEMQKQMEQVRRETEKARKEWQKQNEEWQKEWQKQSLEDEE